jgi:hypothetical protein
MLMSRRLDCRIRIVGKCLIDMLFAPEIRETVTPDISRSTRRYPHTTSRGYAGGQVRQLSQRRLPLSGEKNAIASLGNDNRLNQRSRKAQNCRARSIQAYCGSHLTHGSSARSGLLEDAFCCSLHYWPRFRRRELLGTRAD